MKSIKLLSAVACASLALASCVSMPSFDKQPASITKADVDSASYALGVYFGQMIKMNNLGDLNINEIMKGCNAYLKVTVSSTQFLLMKDDTSWEKEM